MVSRRNFINIFIVFGIVLFLFIFSVFTMDFGRNADENVFTYGELPDGGSEYRLPAVNRGNIKEYFAYIGISDSPEGRILHEWSRYIKTPVFDYSLASGLNVDENSRPRIIFVNTTDMDMEKQLGALAEFSKSGIPVVFLNLPGAEELKGNIELREYLGISNVRNTDMEIEGIRFFEGFLVGGEATYSRTTRNNKENPDYDLPESIPWYVTLSGTKTFAVGILDKYLTGYEDKNALYPAIIWRNSYKGGSSGYIYAVNGDYMSESTGLGFLTSILYDLEEYLLYPVINAKNITVADFPNLSGENEDTVKEYYNRTTDAVVRELIMPAISSIANGGIDRVTCFITTGFDTDDQITYGAADYDFYQKQISNVRSELGISFSYDGKTDFENKIAGDTRLFTELNSGYEYNAGLISSDRLEDIDAIISEGSYFDRVNTFVLTDRTGEALVEYYNNDITLQSITSNLKEFRYSDDLRLRSLMSCIGYSNTIIEVGRAIWPETKEDSWQIIYDDAGKNLAEFFYKYRDFSATTLSESDRRLRGFLGLKYTQERNGDIIDLKVDSPIRESYFLLRTNGRAVDDITGGNATRLEDGIYLISLKGEEARIILKGARKGARF